MRHPRLKPLLPLMTVAIALVVASAGCVRGPMYIAPGQRKVVDRAIVDYPGGFVLKTYLHNLTGPIDVEEDADGNIIILESGRAGYQPRLFCFHTDGSVASIYPTGRRIPDIAILNLIQPGFHIYGPAGGLAIDNENRRIYVTHRDANGFGVVTAFGYDGSHTTIASSIPAQGDNGMSDVTLSPIDGRVWFGVGSATNSGVVGLDNWAWVKKNPDFCDQPYWDLKLNGYQFKSKNPDAGLFGGSEIAVTAPFEPFNVSTQTRIRKVEKPTGAIYSAAPLGGNTRVEAHGIHAPHGLAFNQFTSLFFTAGCMELRGTRPILDDPDALLKVSKGTWYGFPDYSTDLQPITESRFQPKGDMIKLLVKSGYPEISFLLDQRASNSPDGLMTPVRSTLLQTTFPSLSGAYNFDFVPPDSAFKEYEGNAIVPLFGDRSPFATSGHELNEPVGFKVVRVDTATREIENFVRNAKGGPASLLPAGEGLLERPVAVKFGKNGKLYILDFGVAEYKSGKEKVRRGTGCLYVLEPLPKTPSSQPSTTETLPK